jgi:ribokinase
LSQIVVIGSYVQDFVWNTATLPKPGESRIGQFFNFPGGKGFNQAVAAHRLGVGTHFVAALGRDSLAQGARAFAAEFGLAVDWVDTDAATAAASVVVATDGANLICVALGANLQLNAAHVNAKQNLIAGCKVLVTQLETDLSASAAALKLAREHGVLSILNPAPINPEVGADVLAGADILTPNETEFAFLLQHLHGISLPENWWRLDEMQLHAWCRKLSSQTVVITLGSEGVFVSHAPYRTRRDAQFCYRVPAERATPLDTTGAGDAFTGGLAAGLVRAQGGDFASAVRFAGQVAALSVEKPGAAPAMPRFQQWQQRFGSTGDFCPVQPKGETE